MENEQWSKLGQLLSEAGKDIYCGNCKFKLSGQRYCPSCNKKIIYDGEDINGVPNKWVLKDAEWKVHGNALGKAGNAMSSAGNSIAIGCAIPIIILLLLLFLL